MKVLSKIWQRLMKRRIERLEKEMAEAEASAAENHRQYRLLKLAAKSLRPLNWRRKS